MFTPRPTRRQLLHSAGMLAAAPFLRTGLAAQSPSANEGLGILLVGCGNRGSGDGLAAAKFGRIVACCDVDSAQIEKFWTRLARVQKNKPEFYGDYRRALERKDVDAVVIGTPDHWHTAPLLAAMRAGKDVYCEKPLTLTIDEGKLICKVTRETRRVVQVGTQQRSEMKQMFLKAVALARGGRLGKTLTATCSIGTGSRQGPFPVSDPPSTLSWNMWLGQAPAVPYSSQRCHRTFRYFFEYSGGKMTDWGAHHMDIAHWALGVENTGPVEIEATGDLPLDRKKTIALLTGKSAPGDLPNAYSTALAFRIVFRFANGNTIVLQDAPGNGIDITGERGTLWVSRKMLVGRPVDEVAAGEKETAWLSEEVVRLYKGKAPVSHMQNFVECVKERGTPISDVFSHHRAVSSCHLANIALLVGRKLRWNPESQEFIGDAEAGALLSRPQRKPYTLEA